MKGADWGPVGHDEPAQVLERGLVVAVLLGDKVEIDEMTAEDGGIWEPAPNQVIGIKLDKEVLSAQQCCHQQPLERLGLEQAKRKRLTRLVPSLITTTVGSVKPSSFSGRGSDMCRAASVLARMVMPIDTAAPSAPTKLSATSDCQN